MTDNNQEIDLLLVAGLEQPSRLFVRPYSWLLHPNHVRADSMDTVVRGAGYRSTDGLRADRPAAAGQGTAQDAPSSVGEVIVSETQPLLPRAPRFLDQTGIRGGLGLFAWSRADHPLSTRVAIRRDSYARQQGRGLTHDALSPPVSVHWGGSTVWLGSGLSEFESRTRRAQSQTPMGSGDSLFGGLTWGG